MAFRPQKVVFWPQYPQFTVRCGNFPGPFYLLLTKAAQLLLSLLLLTARVSAAAVCPTRKSLPFLFGRRGVQSIHVRSAGVANNLEALADYWWSAGAARRTEISRFPPTVCPPSGEKKQQNKA